MIFIWYYAKNIYIFCCFFIWFYAKTKYINQMNLFPIDKRVLTVRNIFFYSSVITFIEFLLFFSKITECTLVLGEMVWQTQFSFHKKRGLRFVLKYSDTRRMVEGHCTCQRRERSRWLMSGWIHQLWGWSYSLQYWVPVDVCYCLVLDKWKPPHRPRMRERCQRSDPQLPPKEKDHKSQRMWTILTSYNCLS